MYGTLGPVGNYTTQSTYSINQATSQIFAAPHEIDQVQYQIRFYMSEQLPNSDYTLTIVNQGNWFYLDYFEVTVPDSIASTDGPTSANGPSPTPQISTSPAQPDTHSTDPSSIQSSQVPPSSLPVPVPPSQPLSGERQTTALSTVITTLTPESAQPSFVTLSPSKSLSVADSSRTSNSPSPSIRPTRLSGGVIAGITIASVVALLVCLVILISFCFKRRHPDHAVVDLATASASPFREFQISTPISSCLIYDHLIVAPQQLETGFPPSFPTSRQSGANATFSESGHTFGSTAALTSGVPIVPMSRRFSPGSDDLSIVPQIQSTHGSEKNLIDHSRERPVETEKPNLNVGGITSESTDTADAASALPPVYSRY